LPYDVDPSSAFHLIFFPDWTSQIDGRFLSGENIFLCGVPPHMGQSLSAATAVMRHPTSIRNNLARRIKSYLRIRICLHYSFNSGREARRQKPEDRRQESEYRMQGKGWETSLSFSLGKKWNVDRRNIA
jgi:hypothetical protein